MESEQPFMPLMDLEVCLRCVNGGSLTWVFQPNVLGEDSGLNLENPHLHASNKRTYGGRKKSTPLSSSARLNVLKNRYGHVTPGSEKMEPNQFHLHLKVGSKAVNQGLCFFNAELDTYYLKSRKTIVVNGLPRELIMMDLEQTSLNTGYSHIDFYLSGKIISLLPPHVPVSCRSTIIYLPSALRERIFFSSIKWLVQFQDSTLREPSSGIWM